MTNINSTTVDYIFSHGMTTTTRTVDAKLRDAINVLDFGANNTGAVDATAAIRRAIDYACQNFSKTITFPCGKYLVTGSIEVPQGVMLRGEGSQGSHEDYGTIIRHVPASSGDVDLFVFNGDASASFIGTGGGLENFLIIRHLRNAEITGGTAIRIAATTVTFGMDPPTTILDKRAGEMMLTNVLIYTLLDGEEPEEWSMWEHGIYVDGKNADEPGLGRGVRTINLRKVRVAGCSEDDEYVVLDQVTHFYAFGLAVDPGTGGDAGITLRGINDGIYLNSLGCAGNVLVTSNAEDNYTRNLHIDGKINGKFENNDNQLTGTMRVSGFNTSANPVIINKSKLFRIVSTDSPFAAVANTTENGIANVTGDGTVYKINYATGTVYSNTNNNMNATTGEFTCSVAGVYEVHFAIMLFGLGSSHNRCDATIVRDSSIQDQSFLFIQNPSELGAPGDSYCTVSGSAMMNLEYGDKVYMNLAVSGGTKTVGVFSGGSDSMYTWMTVKLLS